MLPCCERTLDGMKEDLLRGGWEPVYSWLWKSPGGHLFYGPHKAWHVWARKPMQFAGSRPEPYPEIEPGESAAKRWGVEGKK